MTGLRRWLGRLSTGGTTRAALFLLIVLVVWDQRQIGGLTVRLIESYLVLATPLIVASIGVTLVIITREFDLSAAGVVTLVNVLMATSLQSLNPWLMVVVFVLLGAGIGLVNGVLVVYGKLPGIAVTLATLVIPQGLALIRLKTPGGIVPRTLVDALKTHATVPRALILILALAAAWLVFRRTRLGMYMFAIGKDEEALRLSGVSTRAVRISIFSIAGALYGFAGVLIALTTETGDANIGNAYLLSTFAAVAVGGTAFVGGTGSAIGSIFGALTLVAIPKVLFVLGISNWMVQVVTGIIILIAVLLGAIAARRAKDREMLSAHYADVSDESA
ncbi:MAG: ABC transporter permease [bacterium]|nr:ABC transporter permease [bacterium]